MGFIYNKPLSIEGVFSKFDTDGNGEINTAEENAAKSMDIFTSFKVKKGMTLETFESTNYDVYAQYERLSTRLYNEQQDKVEQWLKNEQVSMQDIQELELKILEDMEKEVENAKEELEAKLELQKQAQEIGKPFSREELNKMTTKALVQMLTFKILSDMFTQ